MKLIRAFAITLSLAGALAGCGDDNDNAQNAQPTAETAGRPPARTPTATPRPTPTPTPPPTASNWSSITLAMASAQGTGCLQTTLILNSDGTYRRDDCGSVTTGLLRRTTFTEIRLHASAIAGSRLPAAPTCDGKPVMDFAASLDMILRTGRGVRLGSISQQGTCWLGNRKTIQHFAGHLYQAVRETTPTTTEPTPPPTSTPRPF